MCERRSGLDIAVVSIRYNGLYFVDNLTVDNDKSVLERELRSVAILAFDDALFELDILEKSICALAQRPPIADELVGLFLIELSSFFLNGLPPGKSWARSASSSRSSRSSWPPVTR